MTLQVNVARLAFLLIALAPVAAQAQDRPGNEATGEAAEDDAPLEDGEIVVVGVSKPFRLKADHLSDAVKAYNKGRAEFAPESTLYFLVQPGPGGSLDGLSLSFTSKTGSVPVTLDAQNRFVLPDLPGGIGKYTLTANRNRGGLRIRPSVLSPGTSETDRLLGDLRLECRVVWKIAQHEHGLPIRGLFDLFGGCGAKSIAVYFGVRGRLIEAHIVGEDGARDVPLPMLGGNRGYRPPISDKALANTVRIGLTIAPPDDSLPSPVDKP